MSPLFRTVAIACVLAIALTAPVAKAEDRKTVYTRIGRLFFTDDFENGYPTDETVEKLYDERDFQRACQAYLWSLPIVGSAAWQRVHEKTLGAKTGDLVLYDSYRDKLGILTANANRPYLTGWLDLQSAGAMVVEVPKGEVHAAMSDVWQVEIAQLTEPEKYLFVPPGHTVPEAPGHKVIQSPSNNIFLDIRLMTPDKAKQRRLAESFRIYPFESTAEGSESRVISPDGKPYGMWQPRGLAYWELLAEILAREPVAERDRFFMAMLKPLGIEKGARFLPDDRQKLLLTEAAQVGEAMAKATDFDKRMESGVYVAESRWRIATTADPSQRSENYEQLDERAAWFYEAFANDETMHGTPGRGQIYLSSTRDKDGDWLDGGTSYVLRLPPNIPAAPFWSITLYDVKTRALIDNLEERGDIRSSMELLENDDGSIDVYIGPDRPLGKEQNWIPTVRGRAWFAHFRLYSPTQAFFDRTWVLSDIEKRR